MRSCSRWATDSSSHATTDAAGSRRAISLDRFGPLTTAIRSGPAPVTSAITSLIRFSDAELDALHQRDEHALSGSTEAQSSRLARSVCDGTASTTMSAPATACSGSCVAEICSGSSMPGR